MQEEAKVTSKGQVTIPKDVREVLGLKAGSRVVFLVEKGKVLLVPRPKNVLASMEKLRKHIKFSENELNKMIKESKKNWGE